jgi:CRISPR/Cas system-associated exonuclease Cas4 (RecB family)
MEITPLVLKHAPWSFSKIGVLDLCALQYHRKHIEHVKEQRVSFASNVGVVVHYITEHMLKDNEPYSDELFKRACEKHGLTLDESHAVKSFTAKVDAFASWLKSFTTEFVVGTPLVEHRLAIDTSFNKVDYNSPSVLIRGVIDLGLLTKNGDGVIIDHKTGKRKDIGEHAAQLNVYRLFMAAHFPLRAVQCAIHYVETGRIDWTLPVLTSHIEKQLRPWLIHYLNKQDRKLQLLEKGPPSPETGWQCGYCGYRDTCPEGQIEVEERAQKKIDREKKKAGLEENI